ncbi:MAG: adenylate kinase [Treponema sp.]|nr:adenylate kinase [Treponema sp.]
MIILITGASHTGKTLLSQKLLEKYKYPYLSIDHLKMGLIRSGKTELTPADDDKLTDYLWPIVREMVKTAIENKQNLVVEGCYIPFDWRKDFDGQYLSDIKFICLAMTDEYIENHFEDIIRYESEIEHRLFDQDFTIDKIKADNHAFIKGFSDSGENIYFIATDYNVEDLTELL